MERTKEMKNLSKENDLLKEVLHSFLILLVSAFVIVMTALSGCSPTSSPQVYQYITDTLTDSPSSQYLYCANSVPNLDSAELISHGAINISFKGIIQPGHYQFGDHNGISVSGEYLPESGKYAKSGGSLIFTSFLNTIDTVSFEGTFEMIFQDTLSYTIYTIHHIGSFKIHRTCASYNQIFDTTIENIQFCALPLPNLDSADLSSLGGVDAGTVISFKGITQPGIYHFGMNNGVSVYARSYPVHFNAEPGGLFVLTSFLNRKDSVSFEGRYGMIFKDTNDFNHTIYTTYDTGSFSVHQICQ